MTESADEAGAGRICGSTAIRNTEADRFFKQARRHQELTTRGKGNKKFTTKAETAEDEGMDIRRWGCLH